MPTYCYRRVDNGEIVELTMRVSEQIHRQLSDGTIVLPDGSYGLRDYCAEHGGFVGTPGAWPLLSDAAGVAEHQIQEAAQHSRRIGIPTDFTPDGRAIFTSRSHRKKYCEAIGLYDRSGGYSDPQRKGALQ